MYYLLITSITVSIDSFFCGLSLGLVNKNKYCVVFTVCSIVFLMCSFTNYLSSFITPLLVEFSNYLGGAILIGTGIFSLFKKQEEIVLKQPNVFYFTVINSFAVGIDGAIANLSLALMGLNAFYIPIIIALTHAVAVFLGVIFSNFTFSVLKNNASIVPPLLLTCLGYYKLITLI